MSDFRNVSSVIDFPREPPYPPSQAMYDERQNRQEVTLQMFITSLKDLLKNKAFLIHFLAYSCSFGVYTTFATFLNQFVLEYFEVSFFRLLKINIISDLNAVCIYFNFPSFLYIIFRYISLMSPRIRNHIFCLYLHGFLIITFKNIFCVV